MRHTDREGAVISHYTLRQMQTKEGKSWKGKKRRERGGQERWGEQWFSWEGRVFGWKATAYVLLEALTRHPGELPVPTVCSTNKRTPLTTTTATKHTHTPHTTMLPHAAVMSLITIKMSMTASKCACFCQWGFVVVCLCVRGGVCVRVCKGERGRCRERKRPLSVVK